MKFTVWLKRGWGWKPDRPVFDGDYQKLKEETAATLWMKIEEKAEINQEEPEEDKSSFGSYLYSLMKVVLTVFVLILTVAVLFRGWQKFYGFGAKEEIPAVKMETAAASTEAQITIEGGGLNPGVGAEAGRQALLYEVGWTAC